MTAATPITTPKSVNTLRNLCAHKLDVAIATASEKFIDRFAVVSDRDCFAVVPDKDPREAEAAALLRASASADKRVARGLGRVSV